MSTQIGKALRLRRIINPQSHHTLIVAVDHGVTLGPIQGLTDLSHLITEIIDGGANAVIGHIGLPLSGAFSQLGERKENLAYLLHISASTILSPKMDLKVLVNTVEEAVRVGADGVSIHINLGNEEDPLMLQQLGTIARECRLWGMPLLAMMYPRGNHIINEKAVENVKHVARVGAELGADIVKTYYTGTIESFREVVQGCPVPIVVAGGEGTNLRNIFQITAESLEAGGQGISFGRNIFQAKSPHLVIKALQLIIHQNYTVDEAITAVNLKLG
jgi:fructose-bisphosphate aldolase/2-amino-3,7-dideoxy-D-threo-hept-6-ulosonate synthase